MRAGLGLPVSKAEPISRLIGRMGRDNGKIGPIITILKLDESRVQCGLRQGHALELPRGSSQPMDAGK